MAREWSADGKCPICGALFKSEKCPHSYGEAVRRHEDNRLIRIIDMRIAKRMKR